MDMRNLRAGVAGALILAETGWAAYQRYQFHEFVEKHLPFLPPRHNDSGQVVVLMALGVCGVYLLSLAFSGRASLVSNRQQSFAVGVLTLTQAILLTTLGQGYENRATKLILIVVLYFIAAFFFWWSYKRYPLSFNGKAGQQR